MAGMFITLEGTEGCGKSTQIGLTAEWLRSLGREVVTLREPGGTPLGEEIRHLLKHSDAGHGMSPEAELLLMNASRAQLVREVIRPALASGKIVLCDRFFDSTIAYQGHGRGLDMNAVRAVIDFAIGDCQPTVTLLLKVPVRVSEERRAARETKDAEARDRFEQSDRAFFERVEAGFGKIAEAAPERIRAIDAAASLAEVQDAIRAVIAPLLRPA